MPNIVVHEDEVAEFDLTDYYGGKDIQFNIFSLTFAVRLGESFPKKAEMCLPFNSSYQASKDSALIFTSSGGGTYLMFVGSDFTVRAYDITYRYEGEIRLMFERTIPKIRRATLDKCKGLTQLQEGYFFLMCSTNLNSVYNITMLTTIDDDQNLLLKNLHMT